MKDLINKLKNTSDKQEMLNLYSEIKKSFNLLIFPSLQFKEDALKMICENIETYINEYDDDFNRSINSKALDNVSSLDYL